MKCSEAEIYLGELVDGEITSAERDKVESHLLECGPCDQEFENLKFVRESLKKALPVSASASLDQRIMHAFSAFGVSKTPAVIETADKGRRFGIPTLAFVASLLVLTLTTVVAFQIGKIFGSEVYVVIPNAESARQEPVKFHRPDEGTQTVLRTPVRPAPVKIIKVPVVKERIVTRTIYRMKELSGKEDDGIAQKNSNGFQLVSEIKPRIIRKGDDDEE